MFRASEFNSDGKLLYRPLHHTEYMVRPIQSGWSQCLFALECLRCWSFAGLKLVLQLKGLMSCQASYQQSRSQLS